MLDRYERYQEYHKKRFSRALNLSILAIYMISLGGVVFVNLSTIFAADNTVSWDFSNTNHYTLDDGLEIENNQVRMKAKNYDTDSATSVLYHMDEIGGGIITDSSGNDNHATLMNGSFEDGILNNALKSEASTKASVPNNPSLELGQLQSIEAWTKLNEDLTNSSHKMSIVDKGDYQLYYNNDTGNLVYEIADSGGGANTWTQVGGDDINGSWDLDGKVGVYSLEKIGNKIYAGIGNGLGDGEVWERNNGEWRLIGGGTESINNSWEPRTYETVWSLATDGSNLYAGLGSSSGDGEVWKWDGASWEKIGGDGVNSSWADRKFEIVSGLTHDSSNNIYVGLGASKGDSEVWKWDGASWTQIGGNSLNGSWGSGVYRRVESLEHDGTYLYAGTGNASSEGKVWRYDGATWELIGGQGINSSWEPNEYEAVRSMTSYKGELYIGLGDTRAAGISDAEVWKLSGNTWEKIGGDGVKNSWDQSKTYNSGSHYGSVDSLAADNQYLYAGTGGAARNGQVWRYDGATWEQIGGNDLSINSYNQINNSWTKNSGNQIENVYSMTFYKGKLYAGLGLSANDDEVWRWDGTNWEQIGGDGENDSWSSLNSVESMVEYDDKLCIGTGNAVANNCSSKRNKANI